MLVKRAKIDIPMMHTYYYYILLYWLQLHNNKMYIQNMCANTLKVVTYIIRVVQYIGT